MYGKLGVDVRKRGVELFKLASHFPDTFCPVLRLSEEEGFVLHADGIGSKPVQAYLQWKETGETKWFDLTQDLLAMNLDDAVCTGADRYWLVDYLSLNPGLVPKKELLRRLACGFRTCERMLEKHGVSFKLVGGETADLPDQLKTFDLAGVVFALVRLRKLVRSKPRPGDVVVGLRSGGRCSYERRENSGIMCNGITLARHCLLRQQYARKYPEVADGRYTGRFRVDEYVDELGMEVGEAILSPSRIYTPVILRLLERCGEGISGLVHNTGGGLTKCLRVCGLRVIKDSLPEPDPIFRLIQREGRVTWEEMYQVFNMGVGFEVYVPPQASEEVISECERFGIGAQVIGRCEAGRRELVIKTEFGKFRYR